MCITVGFHHGGFFIRDWVIRYDGGKESVVEIDTDKWSYFEAVGYVDDLVKQYKYGKMYRLWWKIEEEAGFKLVWLDKHAEEVKKYAMKKKIKVNIYVEHDVAEGEGVVDHLKYFNDVTDKIVSDKGKGKVVEIEEDEEEEYSSGEDEAMGVRLDDSEDDRGLGLDDGFVVECSPPVNGSNRVMIEGKSYRVKKRACKNPKKLTSTPTVGQDGEQVVEGQEGQEMLDDVELDGEYLTDELDSSDPDDSDKEKGPRYEKFRKEQLSKSYKFKVGMEFRSLDEFKEAITEWTVLNGYQLKFIKNDKVRCRVICRDNCGFLALCSKVANQHTYRIKTLYGPHTCAKVLYNKSASSKWVTKSVVGKMMVSKNDSVRVTDIMDEMRYNHSVGITFGRAWKARTLAKEIIDGDAAKQYTLLWRYASELRRVSPGNTVKINVERPIPTLQPRFGSFYFCFEGCKKGFLSGCRPFIGVDGCHLKTQFGGQLLIAVGRDPNDQYYPLAFGVVEVENKESWRWFLNLLLEDIGTERRWVFISDQQKGLI